jgi:hypothetical protein
MFLSGEFDGEKWLFGPPAMFLSPRRYDCAGGSILLGRVGVELVGGRVAGCRSPSFRRYAVRADGAVSWDSRGLRTAMRSAVLMDRQAERFGIIGMSRALVRRRFAAVQCWKPAPSVRSSFLRGAMKLAARLPDQSATQLGD